MQELKLVQNRGSFFSFFSFFGKLIFLRRDGCLVTGSVIVHIVPLWPAAHGLSLIPLSKIHPFASKT